MFTGGGRECGGERRMSSEGQERARGMVAERMSEEGKDG